MSEEQNNESRRPVVNLQSDFFSRARRSGERITVYLINGKKLVGRLKAFDRYTILLDSGRMEEVIFKHAISTVSQSAAGVRPRRERRPPREAQREAGGPVHAQAEPSNRPAEKRPRPSEQPLSHRMDLSALRERSAPPNESVPPHARLEADTPQGKTYLGDAGEASTAPSETPLAARSSGPPPPAAAPSREEKAPDDSGTEAGQRREGVPGEA